MPDVIPPSNLPPEAQPWGREITKLTTDLETNVSRGLNDVTNTQNALQANVKTLSDQIVNINDVLDRLNALQTYVVSSPNGVPSTTLNTTVTLKNISSNPITITRNCTLLLNLSANISGQANSTGSAQAQLTFYTYILINGSNIKTSQYLSGGAATSTTAYQVIIGNTINNVVSIDLTPGEYTFGGQIDGFITANSSGSMSCDSLNVTATVINVS